ncbi:MAG: hypothetical protein ACKVTZ_05905 [Bacteroidia bacterium]
MNHRAKRMYEQQLKDIKEIRSMMEQSSKFLSLSGLSGIWAGFVALLGAYFAYSYLEAEGLYGALGGRLSPNSDQLTALLGIALAILVGAIGVATFFSYRKAKQKNLPFWNQVAKRLIVALIVPIFCGAVLSFQLALHGAGGFVPATMLIFYGLAHLNASKYTLTEISYLGYSEIVLGLVSCFFLGYGFFFWVIGFGFFHIIYGILMYFKYER